MNLALIRLKWLKMLLRYYSIAFCDPLLLAASFHWSLHSFFVNLCSLLVIIICFRPSVEQHTAYRMRPYGAFLTLVVLVTLLFLQWVNTQTVWTDNFNQNITVDSNIDQASGPASSLFLSPLLLMKLVI